MNRVHEEVHGLGAQGLFMDWGPVSGEPKIVESRNLIAKRLILLSFLIPEEVFQIFV